MITSGAGRAAEGSPKRLHLEWNPRWSDIQLWEYPAAAAVAATSWYVRNHGLPPVQPSWQGANPFDDTLRSWLRAETPAGRRLAFRASDYLADVGYVVPFAVDLPVILLAHRQPRVAWRLLVMDLEAFAVAGFINNALYYQIGRGRPDAADCAVNPAYDNFCGAGKNASFPSGHTLTAATGTGLVCVHHHYLPIYGDATADGSACILMGLVTVATAVTRIMSDRHYATDALAGMAIGFGTGYGLPWWLHYRERGGPSEGEGEGGGGGNGQGQGQGHGDDGQGGIAFLPFATAGHVGVNLVGRM